MCVTHIIEDPPNGLVTFQHLVGKKTTRNYTCIILHGGENMVSIVATPFGFQSTGAEVIVKIVVGIVAVCRIILQVAIGIIERSKEACEVIALALSRPVGDNIGYILLKMVGINERHTVASIIGEMGLECKHFCLGNDPVLIISIADRQVGGSSTVNLDGARPIVVTFRTETQSGKTQLVVNIRTTNPKSSAVQRAGIATLRHKILGNTAVEPHVAIAVNLSTYIVDVKLCRTLGALTNRSLGLYAGILRIGLLALSTFTSHHCARERYQQQGYQ